MPTLLATNELVCELWIATIAGFGRSMVGEQLPADESKWAASGFVTLAVVGGSPDIYLPVKKPVFQLDAYAKKPGSNKPPFWKANNLLERIRYATLARTGFNRLLNLTAGGVSYPSATVQTAYFLTEPRRHYGDVGDVAGYSVDLALEWFTSGDTIT